MKKEELFENINEIDEKYIKIADTYKTKKKSNIWIKWMPVAACLVAAVGIGAFAKIAIMNREPAKTIVGDNIGVEENDKQVGKSFEQERVIAIDTLLASADISQNEQALETDTFHIGKYKAVYEIVASVSSDELKKSTGKEVDKNKTTYYVSGHNDLQYVIKENGGIYQLCKFLYFESDEYPYKDVLELIYDVHSEQDIKEICSEPSKVDNTDEGQALQKEIGSITITDTDSISTIYKILESLMCYGSGNWDKINYGQNDADMLSAVRMGRYLTLNLMNGCVLDSLKYTAVSGMFYEYEGVAYNILSNDEVSTVNQILKIEDEFSITNSESSKEKTSKASNEQTSSSIDNDNYSEIETSEVSSEKASSDSSVINNNYSQEYLNELQRKISDAMVNKKFQCVVSSSVVNNGILVRMTKKCDEDQKLLTEFDELGGAIMIEYEEAASFE